MRRTTGYDPYDDHDDPQREPTPNIPRSSTDAGTPRQRPRGEMRRLSSARRAPQRRGPDPRVWFIRGSIGIAALAGLWLGLQALFPITESQVNEAALPTQTVDATTVGAPEPPAGQAAAPPPAQAQPEAAAPAPAQPEAAAQPAPEAQQPAPAPTAVAEPAPTIEGDRLPGLPTPGAAPAAAAPAPAQPAAEAKPADEAPAQEPAAKPTLEPIPPPPAAPANAAPAGPAAQQASQQARQAQATAPKPQAPAAPPAAPSGGGAFALAASASPSNPISENAMVTVSIRATQGGAPVAGARCMATIYYRTATAKQPNGGFSTNASGAGSFTLDARGTTYGHYIPIDVTCTGRNGTATARTGFTPVRGGR